MREIKVVKKADDYTLGMKVIRVSIGGDKDQGYIVYRGDLKEVQQLLRDVTQAFSQLSEEMPVSPDDGKRCA